MGKIALYRKYRSRALEEVVGQDHITSVLAAALKSGDFSHAYLFSGQRGTGKTSIARILAYLINDLPYDNETQAIDIIEINAADKTSVEDIRELIDKANLAPMSAKYKIYIIDEVHQLSSSASNALLKILEEPPAHVIFILATTDPQKILPTVLSRTQRFHFRPIPTDKVAKHLRMIADKEKIDIDDDALKLLAERGEGSVRDSITLLDQLAGANKKITSESVEDILGLASETKLSELIEAINSKNSAEVINILSKLKEDGIAPDIITYQLIKMLSNLAYEKPRLFELIEKLIEVPKSSNPEIKLLSILVNSSAGNSKSIASKVEKPIEIVAEAKVKYEKEKEEKPEKQPKKTIEQVEKTIERQKKPQKDFNWEAIVASAKKSKPLIASFIEKASYEFDGESLSLYYRYKLHFDKMSDNKNRQILADAIKTVCGSVPKIKIISGSKPKSEVAEKVAAIMGGGDIL